LREKNAQNASKACEEKHILMAWTDDFGFFDANSDERIDALTNDDVIFVVNQNIFGVDGSRLDIKGTLGTRNEDVNGVILEAKAIMLE